MKNFSQGVMCSLTAIMMQQATAINCEDPYSYTELGCVCPYFDCGPNRVRNPELCECLEIPGANATSAPMDSVDLNIGITTGGGDPCPPHLQEDNGACVCNKECWEEGSVLDPVGCTCVGGSTGIYNGDGPGDTGTGATGLGNVGSHVSLNLQVENRLPTDWCKFPFTLERGECLCPRDCPPGQ